MVLFVGFLLSFSAVVSLWFLRGWLAGFPEWLRTIPEEKGRKHTHHTATHPTLLEGTKTCASTIRV